MARRGLAAIAVLLACAAAANLPPHPRLILTDERLADVKAFIANNSQAAAYFQGLVAQGDAVLASQPLPRPPENSSDILMAARAVEQRVLITSMLYRITGNDTYAQRTMEELLSCTAWEDWDIVKHALDTGELCAATGLAVDWTYDYLSARPTQLAAIVAGMVAKGMVPFQQAYATPTPSWATFWVTGDSNWVIVTNGGALIAALSLLGEAGVPDWVNSTIIPHAMTGLHSCVTGFEFAGQWWEGDIYSGYALRLLVPAMASLVTATGDATAGGLLQVPGVLLSPHAQMRQLDNDYRYFNWADCEEGQETLADLQWLALLNGDGAAAWTLRNRLDLNPPNTSQPDVGAQQLEYVNALLYFTPIGAASDRDVLPLDAVYYDKYVATMRSSWSDPNGTFVGIKGGVPSWNHNDADAGSFVFTAGGQRFVSDLGADNYGLPDYFGDKRYTYYRKNNLGHSTLTFDNTVQNITATATIASACSSSGENANGTAGGPLQPCSGSAAGADAQMVLDLTPSYAHQGLASVTRTLQLLHNRQDVLLSDSWTVRSGVTLHNVTWAIQTFANVTISADGASAVLTRGGVSIGVAVQAGGTCNGSGAVPKLTADPIRLVYPEYSTPGLTKLLMLVDPAGCSSFQVLLGPGAL